MPNRKLTTGKIIILFVLVALGLVGMKSYQDHSIAQEVAEQRGVSDVRVVSTRLHSHNGWPALNRTLEYPIDDNRIGVVGATARLPGGTRYFYWWRERATDKAIENIIEGITVLETRTEHEEKHEPEGSGDIVSYYVDVAIPDEYFYFLEQWDFRVHEIRFYLRFLENNFLGGALPMYDYEQSDGPVNYEPRVIELRAQVDFWIQTGYAHPDGFRVEDMIEAIDNAELHVYWQGRPVRVIDLAEFSN